MQTIKSLLYYGAIIAVIVFVTPYIWAFFGRLTKGQLLDVDVHTAVEGRVTRCDSNNYSFLWYLNGSEARYDFGAFDGANALTHQHQAQLPPQNGTGLRYYLEVGDKVHKVANSPLLQVERGSVVTLWTCAREA